MGIASWFFRPIAADFLHKNMQKDIVYVYIVAAAVIKKDGKYLLVQEKQERVHGLWNFPYIKKALADIEQGVMYSEYNWEHSPH